MVLHNKNNLLFYPLIFLKLEHQKKLKIQILYDTKKNNIHNNTSIFLILSKSLDIILINQSLSLFLSFPEITEKLGITVIYLLF